nr:TolC family protein [Desulfobacterales bacterium]
MVEDMRLMWLGITIITLISFISPNILQSSGQSLANDPVLNEDSTLFDYLTYAALNNPGLEAAFNRWKAALEKVSQVKSLPDPKFTYAYFIKNVETRVGPQREKFAILQTFPWFSKLSLRGEAAVELARARKEEYNAAKLRLFYAIKKAYYEYWYLANAISITKKSVELISFFEAAARSKYKTGKASHADIIKAQVELGRMEDRLRALHGLRAPIVSKLNALLNRPYDLPLPWPRQIPEEKRLPSDKELFALLKERNPELKRLDFMVAKESTEIELASKDYYPDITLGLEYIDTENAITPGMTDRGKDPVIAKITINLPIWFGRYCAREREARARYTVRKKERIERENRLVSDLKMALYHFHDAERKINLYREGLIPKAKQSLNVIQEAYSGGKAHFLDLIDAQRILLEFKLSLEKSRRERFKRIAEIEMLVGGLF